MESRPGLKYRHAVVVQGVRPPKRAELGRGYCKSWSPWLPLLSLSLSKNFPPASHNCMAASKHGKSLGSSRSLEGATLRLWLVSGRPLLSDWKEPMTGGEEPVVRLAAARVPNPPSHTACCNEHPSLGAATAPIGKKVPSSPAPLNPDQTGRASPLYRSTRRALQLPSLKRHQPRLGPCPLSPRCGGGGAPSGPHPRPEDIVGKAGQSNTSSLTDPEAMCYAAVYYLRGALPPGMPCWRLVHFFSLPLSRRPEIRPANRCSCGQRIEVQSQWMSTRRRGSYGSTPTPRAPPCGGSCRTPTASTASH